MSGSMEGLHPVTAVSYGPVISVKVFTPLFRAKLPKSPAPSMVELPPRPEHISVIWK